MSVSVFVSLSYYSRSFNVRFVYIRTPSEWGGSGNLRKLNEGGLTATSVLSGGTDEIRRRDAGRFRLGERTLAGEDG